MSIKDVDGHKLGYHPERISEWKLMNKCYPLHIEAGITNRCNHKCIQCTLDWINHKNDSIDSDIFLRMLKSASQIGVKSIYFAGEGEPTLHEDLDLFVKVAYNLGIKVSLATNGSALTPELAEKIMPYLSWLRFSVDANTKETFKKIHGVKEEEFENVFKNIANCIMVKNEFKYKTQIGVQTLLMPENVHEIENLGRRVREMGVHDFQVKPAHSHPKSSYQPGIYKYSSDKLKDQLDKLNTDGFTTVVRTQSLERLTIPRNYERCHAFDVYCLIDALGNVTPCNVFYGREDFIFGNIYKQSLRNIWDSNRKSEIIDKITSLGHIQCKEYRCRQDVMNRYLERIRNPETNDEFI